MYAIIFVILLVLAFVSTSSPSFLDLSSILYCAVIIAVLFPYIRLIYASAKAGKKGRLAVGILLPVINYAFVIYAMLFSNGTLYKVYFPWYRNTPEIEQLRVRLAPLLSNFEYRQAVNAITLVCIAVTLLLYMIAVVLTPRVPKKQEPGRTAAATPGNLFMTMYPDVADGYKFKELKVFRRADGSAYYTQDDGYKHEGTPVILDREVKRMTSGGAEFRTGLGNVEVGGARIEKVKLSAEARKIHEADPLYKKYVQNGYIACQKNVHFDDATLSAYSRMNYTQQTRFAGLYAYSFQLDYKECREIKTLLDRIAEGITPEQAARTEARAKKISIIFYTIVGILVAAYMLWYYFY